MKTRTQILIEDEHYSYLKEEALRERVSISSVVREMVEEAIERRLRNSDGTDTKNDPLGGMIGSYASGHADTSSRADEILYGRAG